MGDREIESPKLGYCAECREQNYFQRCAECKKALCHHCRKLHDELNAIGKGACANDR